MADEIFNMTDTWNDGGTTFTAVKMNVTDTASNAASKLIDLQVGGVSMVQANKAGNLEAAGTVNGFGVISSAYLRLDNGYQIFWLTRASMSSPADSIITLQNNAQNNFDRLQFGGTTSSFPALKRSTTVLQARLADDSDFAPLQGRLRAHANAAAETPSATHTLRVFDAAGTEYKILAVAA